MAEDLVTKKAMCMWCHAHCKVEAHVRGGKLEKVEEVKGERRSERLRPTVRACPRARAVTEYFYHPDRLSYPLKRVGDRGEGKWQRISWEQALDEIAGKIDEIRKNYGAEAVATSSGTYRSNDELRGRFINLLGTPNNIGQGNVCYGTGIMGVAAMGWWNDFGGPGSKTKCIVWWGANPEQSARHVWYSNLDVVKGGAKFIVIDPRRIAGVDRADLWLQVRPGTDAALALGMINVIISEELYDKEFVDKWCYGFDKLTERVKDYPLDKVAEITWVPAEQIREAARMFATNKPAVIYHCMGLEQIADSMETYHARTILTAITGNLDVRGGEELRVGPPQLVTEYDIEMPDSIPAEQKAKQIGSQQFKLEGFIGYDMVMSYAKGKFGKANVSYAHAPSVYRAMATGKPYPVKALLTLSSNPMVTQPNVKVVYKGIKNLDLYVVMDFWMTPSAELADYVLPAACWLERPNLHTWSDTTFFIDASEQTMPNIVEGQYDRRPDFDFWKGLGIRLGQKEYWTWQNLEEYFDYRLKPMGYTFREFIEKTGGFINPPKEEKKYERLGFGTPTGKMELYSTILEKLGYDPLPAFHEPAESPVSAPELAKEYPLVLTTGGRHMPFYHSEHRQIDSLRRQHPHPLVQLNPKTASELGISDGDWVWIETPRGRIRQKCQLFEGMDPRVVQSQHGWWFPELPGEEPWLHGVWESNVNVIVDDEPEHCNRIYGTWPLRGGLCKVYKVKSY